MRWGRGSECRCSPRHAVNSIARDVQKQEREHKQKQAADERGPAFATVGSLSIFNPLHTPQQVFFFPFIIIFAMAPWVRVMLADYSRGVQVQKKSFKMDQLAILVWSYGRTGNINGSCFEGLGVEHGYRVMWQKKKKGRFWAICEIDTHAALLHHPTPPHYPPNPSNLSPHDLP